MHNIDWDDIRFFLAVVNMGSVSQAAQRTGVNQTTVSRRITTLEEKLGKKLFERLNTGWMLTPVGERLVSSAEHMAEEINTIERRVMADSQELSGSLRVTIGDACTQILTMPAIQAFTQAYPDVDIEVVATNDELDLAAREADVALRSTDEPPANLVGKRICQVGYSVYGTKENLQRIHGNPDAKMITCITWLGDGHTLPPWIIKSFPKSQRIHRTNSLSVMLEMVIEGMGIAQMPCAIADRNKRLHRIPAKYVEPGWGLWVLSHVDLRTTARVRVFRDFLVKELEKNKDMIEGKSVV